MGLTIHYSLNTNETEVGAIRSLVQTIRQLATQLPLQEVGDIVEFRDEDCHYGDHDDPERWLKIQAGQYLQAGGNHIKVNPLHVIAFTAIPGAGSEPANIGLARYPDFVEIDRPKKRRLRTKLRGWSWSSFCKTQYASDPSCGGTPNFVRCHMSLISLLDGIQNRQLAKVSVNDESDYWDHRDVRKLAEVVGEWNEMIAAIAGQIKDAVDGFQLQAPITQFANFEHLEAKGRDRVDKGAS